MITLLQLRSELERMTDLRTDPAEITQLFMKYLNSFRVGADDLDFETKIFHLRSPRPFFIKLLNFSLTREDVIDSNKWQDYEVTEVDYEVYFKQDSLISSTLASLLAEHCGFEHVDRYYSSVEDLSEFFKEFSYGKNGEEVHLPEWFYFLNGERSGNIIINRPINKVLICLSQHE